MDKNSMLLDNSQSFLNIMINFNLLRIGENKILLENYEIYNPTSKHTPLEPTAYIAHDIEYFIMLAAFCK